AITAGVDVLDQDGSGAGAIALPQLASGCTIVGREEQRTVNIRQPAHVLPTGAREDVFDKRRTAGGPVTLPQFRPVHHAVPREEKRAVHVGEVAGVRAIGVVVPVIAKETTWVDVLDECGTGGGAVALP